MPYRQTGSLARRAAAVLLLFALLPALLLGLALSAWYGRSDARHSAAMLGSMADGAELALRGYLARHRDAIATIAEVPTLRSDFSVATLTPRLRLLQKMYPGMLTTFAAAADGAVLVASPEHDAAGRGYYWQGVNLAERDYFRAALRNRAVAVTGLFHSHGYGQGMQVGIAAPVYDPQGRLLGVVGAVLDPDKLQADLGELAGPENALALLDAQGRVVAASPGLGLTRGVPAHDDSTLRHALALPVDHVADVDPGPLMERRGLREMLPNGWQVVALGPRQLFAHAWLLALGLLGLLLVLVSISLRLLIRGATRRLLAPVNTLADALARFDPSGSAELPPGLRAAPRELRPIVDALEAHAALIQALLAQREETLAEREHEIEQRTRELRRAVDALAESARTDALTGLTNYRGWRELADTLWAEARQQHGEVAAIACDIDHFKAYNDTYGHGAGDACLRRVATALQASLQRDARVLARSGGEEFIALILPAQRRHIQELAEAARAAVAALAIPHSGSTRGHVTLSLGFSVMLADPDARLDVLLRAADLALYRAKRNGRDQVAELSVSALQKLRNEE
ncbi:MAG: diguanylate cyclase [Metallibacterium scheffleri]|nr:diguanylate cyclase [Metallibacterium scheffleri]